MNAATAETGGEAAARQKGSFFRQGGWMMITAVAGGLLMLAVQLISKKLLADGEYTAFGTLLQLTNWMGIPALGLQMVFAQQTAGARDEAHRRRLISTTKAVLAGTLFLWLVMFGAALLLHRQWSEYLHLKNEWSLWFTVGTGLVILWLPVFQGLLQGRQNFLWLGWTAMVNGLGRVVLGLSIVYFFMPEAAGLMAGVMLGMAAALALGVWQNLDILRDRGSGFHAVGWLKHVVPLTLGFGVSQFLFSTDAIVVDHYLGKNPLAANYILVGTLCRAIVLFTAPLAAVMFPKLIASKGNSDKNGILWRALIATGGLCVVAMIGLTVTSPIFLNIFFKAASPEEKKEAVRFFTRLIPWFGGGMVPLAMGNVLLNYLMAHSRFKIVPALCALGAGYWIALQYFHDSFQSVIMVFGTFTLLFLGICILFQFVIQREDG